MTKIRKPAVAGAFYPSTQENLLNKVDELLNKAFDLEIMPKAIIAPHAGFVYSGSIAASAYKPLTKLKGKIKKIILFGPAHRVTFNGIAFPSSDFFTNALGQIKVDQKTISELAKMPQVVISDTAHQFEHGLEIHLPFLQKIFGSDFELIPAVISDSSPEHINEVMEKLWGLDDTLIVISSNLSHYNSYDEAYQIDRATCQNVENLEAEKLHNEKMCGSAGVAGMLSVAKKKNLKVKLIDFCNSGEVAGKDKDRVVGYASFYIGKEENFGNFLSKAQRKELLRIARLTIENSLDHQNQPPKSLTSFINFNKDFVATYVTLKTDGKIRGDIGTITPHCDILQDVINNAYNAAFLDPQFPKIERKELDNLQISISVLSKAENIDFTSEADLLAKIKPGFDGLILTFEHHRSTFLPIEWKNFPNQKLFLDGLKVKAGLKADFWDKNVKIERYTISKFDDSMFI